MDNLDYDNFIERYRHPRYKGKIINGYCGSASNMPCGDKVVIYILQDKSGRIVDAKHGGHGCALAVASADMLCGYLIGKKFGSACKMSFMKMVRIIGFTPTAGRAGCVSVSLDALIDACRAGCREKANKNMV